MALIGVQNLSVGYGGPLLIENCTFHIEHGQRTCLVGRNGTGKSTIMKIFAGVMVPSSGNVVRQQNLRVGFLPQDVPQNLSGSVYDTVIEGLGAWTKSFRDYHQVCQALSRHESADLLTSLEKLQRDLDVHGGWDIHQRVEKVISHMHLNPDSDITSLSGGMKRRVLLAKAIVAEPDILLLDEPTNHLDIESICWLEDFLLRSQLTILFVTHDRSFLRQLATRIVEVDRACVRSWSCDYDSYLIRKEAEISAETKQNALFDKKLASEEGWLRKGIRARRTRNEGRVQALVKMRETRRNRRTAMKSVQMQLQEGEQSGSLVVRLHNVSFGYGDTAIVRDFSTSIMRGDKIGIIGSNGSGKTTLLRLLLGEILPQKGKVKHGTNLEVAYFDQLREELDPEQTVQYNVAQGLEQLTINGRNRHVLSYLEDFLFTSERARSPVKILSGGERNRLLLAKLFTVPANIFVLDEPTNDLDAETLELLEERLVSFSGTILLVSHDRSFLNNVVTSTLFLEGDGLIGEYVGGYDDCMQQRNEHRMCQQPVSVETGHTIAKQKKAQKSERERRISYKEQRELDVLPNTIETLESELAEIHASMVDPAFYQSGAVRISEMKQRVAEIEKSLHDSYDRWDFLDGLQK